MKQEPGRRQPGIPVLQGGEDVNRDEKKKIIEQAISAIADVDEQMMRLSAVVGSVVESPLWDAAGAMADALVDATALAIGLTLDDSAVGGSSWLHWFVWENGCGQKGLEAGHGDELKPIKTVDDLLDLIEEGQRHV